MQQNSDVLKKVNFLVGSAEYIENSQNTPAMQLFDKRVVSFLDRVSHELLSERDVKQYSDVVSWAFWVRKASILKEKTRYENKSKLGRGVALHIAPSNVPVNFAVSLTSSLLAGNISIVRVSSKDFEQVTLICNAINKVLLEDEYAFLKKYIVIVRYEHDLLVNDYLSSICDLRIVWGGNRTVEELRKSSLPPRSIEMTFPDRYSLSIISSDEYLKQDPKKVASLFYIDTYFTDQNACSSPRLIVWTGTKVKDAQDIFFKSLKSLVDEKYSMSAILAVDKLNSLCELALTHKNVNKVDSDNVVMRVSLKELSDDVLDYKMSGGYFFEYVTNDLKDLVPILKKQCQTISYLGVDPNAIQALVLQNGVRGVDRIVPLGHTMDLEFFWDGYDMIDAMSRNVDVITFSNNKAV